MKISELPALSCLSDDALLVVEHGTTSYKIPYSSFKNLVFNKISSVLSIGSMAYEDKEKYAKFAHGHDYTDFYFFPSYGP